MTALLLYHVVFGLSSTFLKFFEKSFFRKLSLPAKLFRNLHKFPDQTLATDTNFKLLCGVLTCCLTRQLDYNIIAGNKCQHLILRFVYIAKTHQPPSRILCKVGTSIYTCSLIKYKITNFLLLLSQYASEFLFHLSADTDNSSS